MPAPVCRSTRRRHHTTSSRRRSGSSRRSTLHGRGRMKCRSWHKWGPRLDTRGRGDAGSARICRSWRRWALSNERAGRRISLCSSAPSFPRSPSPPLSLTSPDPNRTYTLRPWPAGERATGAADSIAPGRVVRRDARDHAAGGRRTPCHCCCTGLYCLVAADGRATYVPRRWTRADGSRVESEPVTVWVE